MMLLVAASECNKGFCWKKDHVAAKKSTIKGASPTRGPSIEIKK